MLQSATMHKACLAPLGRGFRACVGRAKIPALLCCRLAGVIADLIGRNEPSERRKLFIELQAEGRRIFFGGGRNQQLRWQAANTVLSLGTKIVTSAFRSVFRVVRKWYACARKWIVSRLKQLYDRLGEEGCPRLHFLKANCSDVIFPVVAEFGATLLVIQDARLLLIAFLVLLHHRFHAFLKVSCLLINQEIISNKFVPTATVFVWVLAACECMGCALCGIYCLDVVHEICTDRDMVDLRVALLGNSVKLHALCLDEDEKN